MKYTVLGIDKVMCRTRFVMSNLTRNGAQEFMVANSGLTKEQLDAVFNAANHVGFISFSDRADKELTFEILAIDNPFDELTTNIPKEW